MTEKANSLAVVAIKDNEVKRGGEDTSKGIINLYKKWRDECVDCEDLKVELNADIEKYESMTTDFDGKIDMYKQEIKIAGIQAVSLGADIVLNAANITKAQSDLILKEQEENKKKLEALFKNYELEEFVARGDATALAELKKNKEQTQNLIDEMTTLINNSKANIILLDDAIEKAEES